MFGSRSFCFKRAILVRIVRALVLLLSCATLSQVWSPALGQSGPPGGSPHGNWQIDVRFAGTANGNVTNNGDMRTPENRVSNGSVFMGVGPSGADISLLSNIPSSTKTGGVTAYLKAGVSFSMASGTGNANQSLSGGNIILTLTWLPINNDAVSCPPPSKVRLSYRGRAHVSATAGTAQADQAANANASAGCGGASASTAASCSGVNGGQTTTDPEDEPFSNDPQRNTLTVSGGSASVQIPVSWSVSGAANGGAGGLGGYATAGAFVELYVDLVVDGCNLPRNSGQGGGPFGHVGKTLNGQATAKGSDPTFTRWLPLMFSPVISSQQYRLVNGPLPAPWGNVNCAYSIVITGEPAGFNFDSYGAGLYYLPSPGPDGKYNSPGPPYNIAANTDNRSYVTVLVDADGERIALSGNPSMRCTVSQDPFGAYIITNAGPPGAIKSGGNYTYRFTSGGVLTSISDDQGNQQTLSYTNSIPTVTDVTSGRQLVFYAGTNGYIGAVDAPGSPGTHTALSFDNNGHLLQLGVFLSGSNQPVRTDTFVYNDPNNPDSFTTKTQMGTIASFTYTQDNTTVDKLGIAFPRLATATYGSSTDTTSSDDGGSIAGTWSYSYGATQRGYNNWGNNTRKNTITDARGYTSTLAYGYGDTIADNTVDQYLKILQITLPAVAGSGPVVTLKWNPDIAGHNGLTVTDALNKVWTYGFNYHDHPSLFTDPLNHTWHWNFSEAHPENMDSTVDPTVVTWQFLYTGSLLTQVTDPGNVIRATLQYNAFGQPTSMTVPAGVSATGQAETSFFDYDPTTGDLIQVTDPLGNIATLLYDVLGDPTTLRVFPDTGNPAQGGAILTAGIVWDAAQQLLQAILPNGVTVNNTWTNGQATATQANAQAGAGGATLSQMSFLYDSRGRLYKATDLVGIAAQYRYDKNSNLTQVWDGRGNTTQLYYDPLNEITGIFWPGGAGTSISYDQPGRVSSATDERGVTLFYSYDDASRLTDISDHLSTTYHFGYDDANRITTVTEPVLSTSFNYEPVRKRLTSVSTVGLGGHNYTVSYTYYGDGKAASMTSPAGATLYSYDKAGRLVSLTSPYGEVTSWTYDHIGRVLSETTTTTANHTLRTDYSWGVSGQSGDPSTAPCYLRTITQTLDGQPFYGYTLTHSYLGQLQQQTGSGGGTSETESYQFDNRGRLTSDSNQYQVNGTPVSSSGSYSYDLSNNVQGGVNGWTYNSDNQVTSAFPLGSLAGATGLGYDASGNLTSANGMTFSWDNFGRLSGVTGTPQGTVSYGYDFAGRRISKTVNGQTTYYLYNGGLLLCELDAGGSVLRSYNWGATGLISDHGGALNQSRYYLYDRSGNTRFLLTPNGAIDSRGAYTAWGTPLSGTIPNTAFAWNGRWGGYSDSETGLIQMSARYYAPSLGRFISRDPIGFAGDINLYGYCGGDPVNFMDVSGLQGLGFEQILEHATPYAAPTASGVSVATSFSGLATIYGGGTVTVCGLSNPIGALALLTAGGMYGGYKIGDGIGDWLFGNDGVVTGWMNNQLGFNQPVLMASHPHNAANQPKNNSDGQGGGFDVALGLGHNLPLFAKQTNSLYYPQFPGAVPGTFSPSVFHGALDQAVANNRNINFSFSGWQWDRYVKFLSGGAQLSDNNIANWELYQILNNDAYFSRLKVHYLK